MNLFNPNNFRRTLDALKAEIQAIPADENRTRALNLISIRSHVPFIAVCAYALREDVVSGNVSDIFGQQISNLDFYQYDGVELWEDTK